MRSTKTVSAIAVGAAVGSFAFLLESALVATLPSPGRLGAWWSIAFLCAVAFATGITCGFVVDIFAGFPRRVVLSAAICANALIEGSVTAYLQMIAPEDVRSTLFVASISTTVAHVLIFAIGAVLGYTLRRRASLSSG